MKLILFVCVLLLIQSICFGQSVPTVDKKTLKGITAVEVVIGSLDSDIEALGLKTQNIKTDTELRLRKAGIKVAPEDSVADDIGTLYVHLQPARITDGGGLFVYSLAVLFQQNVRLARSPNTLLFVPTYAINTSVGTVGSRNLRDLREVIGDKVDVFINDFLEMNPKK